jgi:hypothetical protein
MWIGVTSRARRRWPCQGKKGVTLDVPAPSVQSEFNWLSGISRNNGSSSVWLCMFCLSTLHQFMEAEASLKPDPEPAFIFDFFENPTQCIILIEKGMCMTA